MKLDIFVKITLTGLSTSRLELGSLSISLAIAFSSVGLLT
jgi:hypothetical protein